MRANEHTVIVHPDVILVPYRSVGAPPPCARGAELTSVPASAGQST